MPASKDIAQFSFIKYNPHFNCDRTYPVVVVVLVVVVFGALVLEPVVLVLVALKVVVVILEQTTLTSPQQSPDQLQNASHWQDSDSLKKPHLPTQVPSLTVVAVVVVVVVDVPWTPTSEARHTTRSNAVRMVACLECA